MQGDEITEETFVTCNYTRNRYDETEETFELDLYCCDKSEAPESSKDPSKKLHCQAPLQMILLTHTDVKYLGVMQCDFSQFDVDDFEQKTVDGKLLFRISFAVEIVPADKLGVLTFRLRCKGQIIGTYELKYDNM